MWCSCGNNTNIELHIILQEADTDENQGSLGFEEFCSFYKMISTRRDLYLIMISYSNQKEVMDLHDLARFLENEQKVWRRVKKLACFSTPAYLQLVLFSVTADYFKELQKHSAKLPRT